MSWPCRGVEQPELVCDAGSFGAGLDVELGEDPGDVDAGGLGAHVERLADLGVEPSSRSPSGVGARRPCSEAARRSRSEPPIARRGEERSAVDRAYPSTHVGVAQHPAVHIRRICSRCGNCDVLALR